MNEYGSIDVALDGQVATVKMLGHEEAAARAKAGVRGNRYREMAEAFDRNTTPAGGVLRSGTTR